MKSYVEKREKEKQKILLDKVNSSVATAAGNVVYLDKSQKHMYELNNKVRLINVIDYPVTNCDEFLGFICGIVSQDHDLEEMYLDSFLTIASIDSDADIVKSMNIKNYITVDDLYKFSEKEVLQLIQNCEDNYIRNAFKNFQNATRDSVYKSDEPNNEIYCTSVKAKRYINPLVNLENKVSRIKDVSLIANDDINNFLNMKNHKFIGFDFKFKPYEI